MINKLYGQTQELAVRIAFNRGYVVSKEVMFHWARNARTRSCFCLACEIMTEEHGHEMYDVIAEYEEDHFEESQSPALDLNKNWHKEVQRIKHIPRAYAMALKVNESVDIARRLAV